MNINYKQLKTKCPTKYWAFWDSTMTRNLVTVQVISCCWDSEICEGTVSWDFSSAEGDKCIQNFTEGN